MKPIIALRILAGAVALCLGAVQAQTPFPDIPPCHWAAEAVTEIAGKPEVETAQARSSAYLAENAVRQVFEGLRCESPEWSRAFMTGAPSNWAPQGLGGFALQVDDVRLMGDRGVVAAQVQATVNGRSLERSGNVDIAFAEGRWRVLYGSLAALDLPIFP
jgi:hypothetical protein